MAIDAAGNLSTLMTRSYEIDRLAPVVSATTGGVFAEPVTVQLQCDDFSGSGCQEIFYTTDPSILPINGNLYLNFFEVDIQTTVYYQAIDQAGNLSEVESTTYVIDQIGPSLTGSLVNGIYNRDLNFEAFCIDIGGSECVQIFYTLDGNDPDENSTLYEDGILITESTEVKLVAVDDIGNWGQIESFNFLIDKNSSSHPSFFKLRSFSSKPDC